VSFPQACVAPRARRSFEQPLEPRLAVHLRLALRVGRQGRASQARGGRPRAPVFGPRLGLRPRWRSRRLHVDVDVEFELVEPVQEVEDSVVCCPSLHLPSSRRGPAVASTLPPKRLANQTSGGVCGRKDGGIRRARHLTLRHVRPVFMPHMALPPTRSRRRRGGPAEANVRFRDSRYAQAANR
jgi:hypothetical protein